MIPLCVACAVVSPVVGGSASSAAYSPTPPPTLMRWCELRRTLALAGRASLLRLWDAHTEMLYADINTGEPRPAPPPAPPAAPLTRLCPQSARRPRRRCGAAAAWRCAASATAACAPGTSARAPRCTACSSTARPCWPPPRARTRTRSSPAGECRARLPPPAPPRLTLALPAASTARCASTTRARWP